MAVIQLNNVTPIGSMTYGDTTMTVSHEGYLVKADVSFSVVLAGAGDVVLGVIPDTNLYANGDPLPIIGTPGQIVQVIAGAAGFAADDLLKAAAGGGAVTAGSTDAYFAQALETATSGNLGACVIRSGGHLAASASWTRTGTVIAPTTANDTIGTGLAAVATAAINMTTDTIAAVGTDTNIDIEIVAKGTGQVLFTNNSYTEATLLPVIVATQGTTGTGGTAGQIAVSNMTASAVVIATLAESVTATALAYVVATTGHFTVYDNTNTAISGKKVNYIVLSL